MILHRVTWNGGKVSRTEISLVMLQPINRMKSFWFSAWSLAIALVLTSCGQPERPKTAAIVAQPFRVAGDFNEVGKITFFQGESCASQIMFVFRSGRSTSISLAAPFRVSKILTDAAQHRRTVHVWGKWRRGKAPSCSYVEATQVEIQKSFW